AHVLSNPDYIKQVLVDNASNYVRGEAVAKVAQVLGRGLAASDGDHWRHQRRLLQPHFHKESIAALGTVMVSTATEAIARWRSASTAGEVVDLAPEMQRLALDIVTRALLGADVDSTKVGHALSTLVEETYRREILGVDPPDLLFGLRFGRALRAL